MKVLIACEESQAVCKAFRARGHEAYSCDILPCSGRHPEWHIQDDVLNHLDGWDFMVGHPPCTYTSRAGIKHLIGNFSRFRKLIDATDFFKKLWNANIPEICLEQPLVHWYAKRLFNRDYTQKIQPYNFGHPEQKSTCLYLKNLPPLMSTLICTKREKKKHKLGSGHSKERSKTFPGIAKAMAEQWG